MSAAASIVSDLHLSLESPAEGAIVDDEVAVSGWCLSRGGERCAVRVRAQEHSVELPTGEPRADVAASFPDAALAATSGFAGVLPLPAGAWQVGIDVRVGHGDWQPFGVRSVVVRATPLRASLDTPSPMRAQTGLLRFSGWCVHPKYHIADLRLAVGADRVACQFGLDRADVGAAFPHAPGAARSGFEVSTNVGPGRWPVSLIAVLDNGSEIALEFPQPLLVRNLPLPVRAARLFGFCVGAVRYGWRLARTWLAENRRLPRPREIPAMIRFALERYRQLGHDPVQAGGPPGFSVPEALDSYVAWQAFNGFTEAARRDLEQRLAGAGTLPRLSVVMPVYNAPLDLLAAAVDSVRAQVFDNWELCIADDGSTAEGVHEYLARLGAEEPRVRVCLRAENGNISRATNSAVELASGEFLVLLDQDDLLTPDALAEIALCVQARPDADIVYSDDDKIDSTGRRFAPQFKPDWSPELLLGYMYFSHVFAVRRALYAEVGGMRVGFEGSQDYDFALRATERARAIAHIPQVLYHWRVLPGSTAASGGEKPASFEAGRSAVEEALHRRGIHAQAQQPDWARKAKVGIFGIEFPDDGPRVSIIIPTRNGLEILRRCIDSLRLTTYRNYEVIVVDNDSDDAATIEYLEALPHRVERISNPHGRFNFAAINNRAAERAQGELLLFLNNDTEVIAPRWLSQMVGYAGFAGVGAVGARLLFPDRRIQHAGIVHGYYRGLAGPAFKLAPEWDNGYLSYARVARNYEAVTAACMLTPRATFLELGGFDEVHFEVAYNDVDYCYRLGERGLRSVYCADAELLHHEGHSRGFFDRPQEIAAFRRKYAGKRDAYYSPHLTLDHERFAIKPRRFRSDANRSDANRSDANRSDANRSDANRPETGKPVRALMCAFNLNWEGAPYSQLELTLGLRRGGHVEPVVYAPKDGPLRAAYEQAGITVHVFDHPLAGVFDEAAYDRALERFGAFIGELGVDVVYGNTLQTFYAIDAAHRLGVPCLWNPRESEPWQTYFNFLPAPLAARALHCFAYPYRVIFVAEATRKVWAPLESRGNFAVVHNGLDLTRLHGEIARYPRESVRAELGIGADDVVFLLPGTVCERKGQHDLVNALAQLQPPEAGRVRCFIVGDRASSYSVELHRLVAALPEELRRRVRVVPETHEIARYYQAADVFVCTSRVESFPRVVLEAMAYGLPVVSTRVFGIAEQVGENVNALLYDPGDASRLAAHLRHLVSDDAVRLRLQANSPHVLATLNTFDEMVAAYATAFREAALSGQDRIAAGTLRPQSGG